MEYELAKELKDAGFSQPAGDHDGSSVPGYWFTTASIVALGFPLPEDRKSVYIPSLSELIEACGDQFCCLQRSGNEWMAEGEEYTKDDIIHHSETANDPDTAVARLWLALHPRQ